MAGFCEHGNEHSGAIKCEVSVDYFKNDYLLKNNCAPWS